jgi:hypothetical protein
MLMSVIQKIMVITVNTFAFTIFLCIQITFIFTFVSPLPFYHLNLNLFHHLCLCLYLSLCLQIKVLRRSCKHRTVEGVAAICDGYGTEDKVPYNIDSNTVYMALRNFQLKVSVLYANVEHPS